MLEPGPLFAQEAVYAVSGSAVDLNILFNSKPGSVVQWSGDYPIEITPRREWWEPVEDEL